MTDEIQTSSGALNGLPLEVRSKTLLSILLVVPFFLAIATADYFFLGKEILHFTAEIPRNYILYAMAIIALPHIVASLITFADKEYLTHYRKPLGKGILIAAALGVAAPYFLGTLATWLIMAFYTMYHTLAQQFGIALMMMRRPSTPDFAAFKWLLLLPSSFAYLILLEAESPLPQIVEQIGWFLLIACPIAAAFFGIRFYRDTRKQPHEKIGLIYLLGRRQRFMHRSSCFYPAISCWQS